MAPTTTAGSVKRPSSSDIHLLVEEVTRVGKARRAYIRARLLVERAREEARREAVRKESAKCPGSIYRPIRER